MKSRLKRIWKIIIEQFALLSLELVLVLFFSLIAFIIFIKISDLLLDKEISAFDEKIYYWVRYYSSDFLDFIMLGATFLGNRQFIIFFALGVLIYFLFIKPHRWYSIQIPAVALGSISANITLKHLFDRERPILEHMVDASGLSFPSGHAMFNLSFYGLLLFIIWKHAPNNIIRYTFASLLVLLIFLIGISRIYLGVHYASDVFAGFAAGFLWLILSLVILNQIERAIKKKRQEQIKNE